MRDTDSRLLPEKNKENNIQLEETEDHYSNVNKVSGIFGKRRP